jgi:solute carrier family 13 (sodium-dependent dicarboxylate transporter), member 2/3/5
MFVGIMILAFAMEHVGLHRRLALLVLRYVGSSITWYVVLFSPDHRICHSIIFNRSMGGLMGVSAFLSMWINNSVSANIMIPTALAIVSELQSHHQAAKLVESNDDDGNQQMSVISKPDNHASRLLFFFVCNDDKPIILFTLQT